MPAAYFDWEPEIDFISGGPDPDTPERIIDLIEAAERDNSQVWPFLGDVALDTYFTYQAGDRTVAMQVKGISSGGYPQVGVKVMKSEGVDEYAGRLKGYFFPKTNEVVEGLLRVGFSPVIQEQDQPALRRLPLQGTRPYFRNGRSIQRATLG